MGFFSSKENGWQWHQYGTLILDTDCQSRFGLGEPVLSGREQRERQAHQKKDGHSIEAHLLQSAPFLSGRIELTSHPPSHPLIPPLPLPFRSGLQSWFIWWKEFCTGLWLWWYPYTVTFSPRQMFLSQNMLMFNLKSPYKHIKWSQHVFVDHGWQRRRGTATRVLGAGEQTRRARKREAERQTVRQDRHKEVSDICSRQLMTPGWPGGVRGAWGQKRVDNSHKCCNGWYFEFNSVPGSVCLNWFIVSYHFTQNFPFICFVWFSAELSSKGVEIAFSGAAVKNTSYMRQELGMQDSYDLK